MATGPKIQLVGGGGHALVVADAARAAGFTVEAFWDDDPAAVLGEALPRAGSIADLADTESDAPLIVTVGGLASRRNIIDRLGDRMFATVVHPSATVSPEARLGPGTYVGAGAIVNPRATIGAHGIVNTGAIVEHECAIGENVHLGPRSVLGGAVVVGPETLVGLGAAVLPRVRIGERCVVAAGAVVTHQIPDRTTAVGVPARPRAMGGPLLGVAGGENATK